MNESLQNVIKDGIILLVASSCLAIGTDQFFNLFKDDTLDGNPLVTTVSKAAANDRQKKDDLEKEKKGEKKEADEKLLASEARKQEEISKKLEDNLDPSKNKGIDYIHFRDNHDATALMMVCYVNYNKVETTLHADEDRLPYINMLIEKGSDIHATDKDGWTPLCWASWSGLPKICQRFIDLGSNINITDKTGNTPLMMAAVRGNHEIIELYLRNGADKDAKCNKGMTALDYAQQEFERINQKTIMILDSNMAENKEIHKQRFQKTVALLSSTNSK